MRLLPSLLDSPCFNFSSAEELIRALGEQVHDGEADQISRLVGLGLPPVTSAAGLATMIGLNQGLVWSLLKRPAKHYRTFWIPKGSGRRKIDAPRVALKVVQKWMAVGLARAYVAPDHVFGFVSDKDHVQAAAQHCGSEWVLSVDIENFFPSTSQSQVVSGLTRIGYLEEQAELIAQLSCLNGGLAQGAPCSPVLSNIAFWQVDTLLSEFAKASGFRLSRYADDVTLSGAGDFNAAQSFAAVSAIFSQTPWRLSESKMHFARLPARLKVHGLVVHGESPRLTKGYRNKLRAFRHMVCSPGVSEADIRRMRGHIAYANRVLKQGESP